MKNLKKFKDVKLLNKQEQKNVIGGGPCDIICAFNMSGDVFVFMGTQACFCDSH